MSSGYNSKEDIREMHRKGADLSKISIIPSKAGKKNPGYEEERRVAIYCRVSTDGISQTQSFETQKSFYINYVRNHPGWNLIGLYSDEGLSATSMKSRKGLQMMLRDARAGKIDLIITKSVSRFSRNADDFRQMVKELKNLPRPVEVFFETERSSTFDPAMELVITILAIFAEQESIKKSEAITSAIRMRFKNGFFLVPASLGYKRTGVNRIEIDEEEAETIKLIYDMYLAGYAACEISEILIKLGRRKHTHIYTDGRIKEGGTDWTPSYIMEILENEKKCGDVRAQKTYTVDCMEHITRKNNLDVDQYYALDQHPAIVSREDFYLALKLKKSNRGGWNNGIQFLKTYLNGELKGSVLTIPRWHGFTTSDYIRASLVGYGIELSENEIYPYYVLNAMKSVCNNEDIDQPSEYDTEDNEADHFYEVSEEEFLTAPLYVEESAEENDSEDDEPEYRHLFEKIKDKIVKSEAVEEMRYMPVSGRLFNINQKPLVTIDKCGLKFNKACYKTLLHDRLKGERIEVLYNPIKNVMHMRTADEGSTDAHTLKWIKAGAEHIKMVRCPAESLTAAIFDCAEWDTEKKYKALGFMCEIESVRYMVFDLSDPIICVITSGQTMKNDRSGQTQEIDIDVEIMPEIEKGDSEIPEQGIEEEYTTGKVENKSRAVYFEQNRAIKEHISIKDHIREMYDPRFIKELKERNITPDEGWDYLRGIIKWTNNGFQIMSSDWKDRFSEKTGQECFYGNNEDTEIKETVTGWTTNYSFPSRKEIEEKIRTMSRMKEAYENT
ncbi:MAG: recombinase family protein [Lachnospiraceae bacterium]|nr:recombinase family protein [Lachnospiraceae bacterium]